jgi:signal transduction histidine kinase
LISAFTEAARLVHLPLRITPFDFGGCERMYGRVPVRKVALVFAIAIVTPSLVLAWLAFRSLRGQRFAIERQEALICQGISDALANDILAELSVWQRDFARQVEEALGKEEPADIAPRFDPLLRQRWTNAVVGFAVTMQGEVLSPMPFTSVEARQFRLENDRFLCSKESVEVVWNSPKGKINLTALDSKTKDAGDRSVFATKNAGEKEASMPASAAQFREIVGDSAEGTIARFLQNQLHLLLWHRSPRDTNIVFGAELRLGRLAGSFRPLVKLEPALNAQFVALLRDDRGRTIAAARDDLSLDTEHPIVSSGFGDALPHWEVAVYPVDPKRASQTAETLRLMVGLLIALLLLAVGVGIWLVATDYRRQLALARQKTDFVSNVSHELKTPLTSIRMFAEMLAEGRVASPEKQQRFLRVINAEATRLGRLINNVLDFARRERGEQQYHFSPCDLAEITAETIGACQPHLETTGFKLNAELPAGPAPIQADRDAIAQVLVNLLSNAEKYSGASKEILVTMQVRDQRAEVRVLDRGLGVPPGCEKRIFEQFYRAHDSLSSGIPGSGLGLTLARQIARAHGGDVTYAPRDGGGSEFVMTLPIAPS